MILPIVTYGSEVLRQRAKEIEGDSPQLQKLIDNMIQTMHGASGIGLAAPQVGVSSRVFVVDLSIWYEDETEMDPDLPDQPMVFINPVLVDPAETESVYEEGCLSIPEIREDVSRPDTIEVDYTDRYWVRHKLHATEMLARVILHEHDHLEGILFIDHITPFRRRLLRRRLKEITVGNVEADYPLLEK
ncbi:MAG: peptide deformylase [Rhodothermales bacterium]|nr:peptide deformylase [Rhodothermales bacterium]